MKEYGSLCLKGTPAPPPPLGLRKMNGESITNKEIKKFWRQKQMVEEEHLFAAIKAAARVRARKLSDDDYRRFEASLDLEKLEILSSADKLGGHELNVGIKDWWTKSKYAYLNQPALSSPDSLRRRRRFSFVPNCFSFKPTFPLYPTSLCV